MEKGELYKCIDVSTQNNNNDNNNNNKYIYIRALYGLVVIGPSLTHSDRESYTSGHFI